MRAIAADYHTGQRSALYAFASTGAIDKRQLVLELREALAVAAEHSDFPLLALLLAKVELVGSRGPQPGWNEIPTDYAYGTATTITAMGNYPWEEL